MNHKPELSVRVAIVMLLLGICAFIIAITYTESIVAFIGLGLSFWGALLLFIKPTKYVQFKLLNSVAISSLETIDFIIGNLEYEGKAVCLPPEFSKTLQRATAFVTFEKNCCSVISRARS